MRRVLPVRRRAQDYSPYTCPPGYADPPPWRGEPAERDRCACTPPQPRPTHDEDGTVECARCGAHLGHLTEVLR